MRSAAGARHNPCMSDRDDERQALRERIQDFLQAVAAEAAVRRADPALDRRVLALKHYQQQRFAHSYADLLETPRYGPAARFFLDELYGPKDFSQRDAQFARVVPTLVRLFPEEVVLTVAQLAELHALSEQLDNAMARHLPGLEISAEDYRQAWQAAASPAQREQQIRLLLAVGETLEGLTRKPLLRQALRMMRGPAAAAGLGELQQFLETGFDTFKAMKGAQEFLQTIATRERALAATLFAG